MYLLLSYVPNCCKLFLSNIIVSRFLFFVLRQWYIEDNIMDDVLLVKPLSKRFVVAKPPQCKNREYFSPLVSPEVFAYKAGRGSAGHLQRSLG